MRVNRLAQGSGSLAMDDPDAPDPAFATLDKVIIEQPGDLRRTKGVQIQFPVDGDHYGIDFVVVCHNRILVEPAASATRNP